jgi:hypothetical protein
LEINGTWREILAGDRKRTMAGNFLKSESKSSDVQLMNVSKNPRMVLGFEMSRKMEEKNKNTLSQQHAKNQPLAVFQVRFLGGDGARTIPQTKQSNDRWFGFSERFLRFLSIN